MNHDTWQKCGAPAVERCKREILEDIRAGRVPASVRSFSELHEYVDANEYGGACEDDENGIGWWDGDEAQRQEAMAFWERVQGEVSAWLERLGGEGAILEAAGLPVRPCGLNADWCMQAWYVGPGTPNRNDTPQSYIIDNEDGTYSLVSRVDLPSGDGDIRSIHTGTLAECVDTWRTRTR